MVLVGMVGPSAVGVTRVRHALLERRETVELAQAVRRQQAHLEAHLRHRISWMKRAAGTRFVTGARPDERRRTGRRKG